MKPIRLTALAAADLRDAHDWYEDHSRGRGKRLIESVNKTMAQIRENPMRFPVVHGDIRRALVQSFTYAIFYQDLSGFIRVIAIIHQHRNPRVWQRR